MDRETIQQDIKIIINKWIGKQNSDYVRSNIKYEVENFLDSLMEEKDSIIESYGKVEVYCRDKDTINLIINPEIKWKPIIIKHLYTGPTKENFIQGDVYDVYFDRFTLKPVKIKLNDIMYISTDKEIHKQFIYDMISSGVLVELAKFRENRINQILED
jgi:hypothetical protein